MSQNRFTPETTRLDDAARAGWLYFVAGNTQDEIARKMAVSRQTAQRLVAMAIGEGLVKVRLDHPIGRCMDLAAALRDRFCLQAAEVVPSDPEAPELLTGVAITAAALLERVLKSPERRIVSLGTGRNLRAMVEQLPRMSCPQHVVVSRLGNMMQDGSATPYNATIRLAERIGAPHYPYPLPVLAGDRIVAVLDLKTDRAAGRLLMQQWTWLDGQETPALKAAIEEELQRFERFQLGRDEAEPEPLPVITKMSA